MNLLQIVSLDGTDFSINDEQGDSDIQSKFYNNIETIMKSVSTFVLRFLVRYGIKIVPLTIRTNDDYYINKQIPYSLHWNI